MKIKVCGLKYEYNIAAVAALTPDYMGFIFYGHSPRFVDGLTADVLKSIPASIIKTGVFVDENAESINLLIDKYGFGAVQLHGDESPEFCNALRPKVKVIKAFGISIDFDFNRLKAYVGKVDLFLFDTKTDLHGGSGKTFDWSILNKYQLPVPFFLSGGLSPENIEEVKDIKHEQFYGVDLNSKFELAPGNKDIEKLEKAFDIIKQDTYQ